MDPKKPYTREDAARALGLYRKKFPAMTKWHAKVIREVRNTPKASVPGSIRRKQQREQGY